MDPSLEKNEGEVFKTGLWELHQKTSRLPPLTDRKFRLKQVRLCKLIIRGCKCSIRPSFFEVPKYRRERFF